MKPIISCGLLLAVFSTAAYAADILPGHLGNEQGMVGYEENTLIVFDPDVFEHHTWYNKDGSDVHFDAAMAANGQISLTATEGHWKFKGEQVVATVDNSGKETALELQGFSMNSHVPGQIWHELVPEGPRQNGRDLYTIVPAHQ